MLVRRAGLVLALSLVACAQAPERRHAPAQLQAYRPADFRWQPSSEQGERSLRERELVQLRARLALPPGPARDAELPRALAAVQLFNTERAAAQSLLLEALPRLPRFDAEAQRALLAAAHALAPEAAAPLLALLLAEIGSPREFAAAAHVLLRADAAHAPAVRRALASRLAAQPEEPRLLALQQRLDGLPPPASLRELLAAPLLPGHPVVFSLQRPDRRWRGLALVRGADGRFLREPDGRLFAIPQLALALSELPGSITLGNTPRGLFTVVGAGTASNPWIGPTPYLHAMLPLEAEPAQFFHGRLPETAWTQELYERLLPPAWRPALREAWWAGRAGRSEILMHGTTVNPAYYAGSSFFPGTPSAGCLVADERWDPQSGRLLASDQLRLAQAFMRGGQERGFLVVAELAGEGPVRLDELRAALPDE